MRTLTANKFKLQKLNVEEGIGVFETRNGNEFTQSHFKYIDFDRGLHLTLSPGRLEIREFRNGTLHEGGLVRNGFFTYSELTERV